MTRSPPKGYRNPQENSGNLSISDEKGTQITPELLQQILFELIAKCVELWRKYRETGKSKGLKINQGMKIALVLVQAIRVHPDIQTVAELRKLLKEVEEELAIARRIRGKTRGLDS